MPQPQRLPQRLPPRGKRYNAANIFDYDESHRPPDTEYQWVALTVAGQETRNLTVAQMNGWTPVPADRHPELAGPRSKDGHIVVGGQMLMEIPKQYYDEDKADESFAARNAVASQIARLGLESKRQGVKRPFAKSDEVIEQEVVE